MDGSAAISSTCRGTGAWSGAQPRSEQKARACAPTRPHALHTTRPHLDGALVGDKEDVLALRAARAQPPGVGAGMRARTRPLSAEGRHRHQATLPRPHLATLPVDAGCGHGPRVQAAVGALGGQHARARALQRASAHRSALFDSHPCKCTLAFRILLSLPTMAGCSWARTGSPAGAAAAAGGAAPPPAAASSAWPPAGPPTPAAGTSSSRAQQQQQRRVGQQQHAGGRAGARRTRNGGGPGARAGGWQAHAEQGARRGAAHAEQGARQEGGHSARRLARPLTSLGHADGLLHDGRHRDRCRGCSFALRANLCMLARFHTQSPRRSPGPTPRPPIHNRSSAKCRCTRCTRPAAGPRARACTAAAAATTPRPSCCSGPAGPAGSWSG